MFVTGIYFLAAAKDVFTQYGELRNAWGEKHQTKPKTKTEKLDVAVRASSLFFSISSVACNGASYCAPSGSRISQYARDLKPRIEKVRQGLRCIQAGTGLAVQRQRGLATWRDYVQVFEVAAEIANKYVPEEMYSEAARKFTSDEKHVEKLAYCFEIVARFLPCAPDAITNVQRLFSWSRSGVRHRVVLSEEDSTKLVSAARIVCEKNLQDAELLWKDLISLWESERLPSSAIDFFMQKLLSGGQGAKFFGPTSENVVLNPAEDGAGTSSDVFVSLGDRKYKIQREDQPVVAKLLKEQMTLIFNTWNSQDPGTVPCKSNKEELLARMRLRTQWTLIFLVAQNEKDIIDS